MHKDARNLDSGSLIEGDVCIVGAGAAGISMALEWMDSGHTVVLLEGGGFNYDPNMQDMYAGQSVGEHPYQVPLLAARLHYFGGTTNHWAGWCAPMEPLNFEKRDWVPYSGWPFDKKHLDPFYARAHTHLELGPYQYDAAYYMAEMEEYEPLPFDESRVWTKMWQFSPPTRFGTKYRQKIVDSENLHLYTYANVTQIEANESLQSVTGLTVKTSEGKTHRVQARYYVLACGAIQNARLLLASNQQASEGLGNDNDLVGRFFMEHIEMGGAQLMLEEPEVLPMYGLQMGSNGVRVPRGELAISEAVQKEYQILNTTASLWGGSFPEEMTSFFQRFSEGRLRMREDQNKEQSPERRRPATPPPPPGARRDYRLSTRAEQAPNPDSRVVLSKEKDALGVPLADLHWQLTELDQRSIRMFFEIVGVEIGKTGRGRVQLLDWLIDGDDSDWPSFLSGGFHHMGTTRMHGDPKQGVVDADAKVHGIENLYVAGASTFTTSGAPNPTLTLVALALRLSDHLKAKLS